MFPGQPSHRISIHAPREGGDVKMPTIPKGILRFQSTPPARGATYRWQLMGNRFLISIHAPREGGDTIWTIMISASLIFQSTPPARGAT